MTNTFIDEFVLNKVSDEEYFGVDLRNSEPFVLKFEGVNSVFAKSIQDGLSADDTLKLVLEQFEGCERSQIESDYKDFIKFLEEQNLLIK